MEDGESNKAVGDIVVGYAFMAKKMGSMAKIVQDNSSNDKEGSRVVFKPLDLDVPLEQQVCKDTTCQAVLLMWATPGHNDA